MTVYPCLFSGSLKVEYEQAVYTVVENEGSVQACAVVSGDMVSENFTRISLHTEDDTAKGILIFYTTSNISYTQHNTTVWRLYFVGL